MPPPRRIAGSAFSQRVERARRRRDVPMDGCSPLPGVRLRLDDHVGGALGGRAAVRVRVEGMSVFGGYQPLLLEMREHGWLQCLRRPRHHHVRLAPGHDGRCLGDGGEPARLCPRKPNHRPAYAQRSRDELPVGHEQGRLAGRAKREPVGHREAPRVGDARRQPSLLHCLQGGVEADHRAAVEEVGEVARDARVRAVVVGMGLPGRSRTASRPVIRGERPLPGLPHGSTAAARSRHRTRSPPVRRGGLAGARLGTVARRSASRGPHQESRRRRRCGASPPPRRRRRREERGGRECASFVSNPLVSRREPVRV